jgi:peptide/nickel transport system permease protein
MGVLMAVGRRLFQVSLTVVVVALLIFGLMRLLPGDPALVMLGDRATDARIAEMHHQLGLDEPVLVQFWQFLLRTVTLQLGDSITLRVPVSRLIVTGLPITLMLTTMAAVMAIVMAVPLAFVGALRPDGWADQIIRVVAQVSLSMPVFYIGLVLLITLAAGLHWFPVGGIGSGFFEDLYYLFLPALTLALSLAAVLLRNLRQSLADVLNAEYIGFAVAKGLPPRLILGRHVLRNAIVSTVTLLGLNMGTLVGGAVITESVFAIPGVGRLIIDSIFARDYPVVQGLSMVLAVMVSVVFLMTDAVQALLDPRLAR